MPAALPLHRSLRPYFKGNRARPPQVFSSSTNPQIKGNQTKMVEICGMAQPRRPTKKRMTFANLDLNRTEEAERRRRGRSLHETEKSGE